MNGKKWYQSKTILFNLLIGIVTVFSQVTGIQIIPMDAMAGVGVLGNIALRGTTTKPIE
jgi:hypothetical protein